MPDTVANPLRQILRVVFNVSAWSSTWRREMRRIADATPHGPEQLRRQLADAIQNRTLSVAEFEALTEQRIYSAERLDKWLRDLWFDYYGHEYSETDHPDYKAPELFPPSEPEEDE